MPPLNATGSRIDGEHIIMGVVHHLEDVRMPAHENLRTTGLYQGLSPEIIMPGVSPDMGHKYRHTPALEKLVPGVVEPDVTAVTVPINPHEGFEGSDGCREFSIPAEIPGVPELVHRIEELAELFVEDAVRVGNKTYIHNPLSR